MFVVKLLVVVVVDFSESLSVVSEAVEQAEFLAIDAEFSGSIYNKFCCLPSSSFLYAMLTASKPAVFAA